MAFPQLLMTLGILVLLAIGFFVWLISEPAELGSPSKSEASHQTNSVSANGSSLGEESKSNSLLQLRDAEGHSKFESYRASNHDASSKIGPSLDDESTAEPVSERESILEKVHEAAITYDPASLPVIEPYLNSPDPEVRFEAMNAVVTLGDAAGAPLLRAQAARESDDARKKELLNYANWLELPPANLVLPKKTTQPSPTTSPR